MNALLNVSLPFPFPKQNKKQVFHCTALSVSLFVLFLRKSCSPYDHLDSLYLPFPSKLHSLSIPSFFSHFHFRSTISLYWFSSRYSSNPLTFTENSFLLFGCCCCCCLFFKINVFIIFLFSAPSFFFFFIFTLFCARLHYRCMCACVVACDFFRNLAVEQKSSQQPGFFCFFFFLFSY